ncbi:MAG: hypothetical protein JJ934_17985, partial [Pseudomonadales bacterium]|nr:hypothetical protein [Pseudomonadales bacterium]
MGKLKEKCLGNDFEMALAQYRAIADRVQKVTPKQLLTPAADMLFIGTTWVELTEKWLNHVSQELAPKTYQNYAHIIDDFNEHSGGFPRDCTVYQARSLLREFMIKKAKDGYPVQANRVKTCIGSCFQWAMKMDIVRDTPVYALPSWKEAPKARR